MQWKILNYQPHKVKVYSLFILGKFLWIFFTSILVFVCVKNCEKSLSLVTRQKQKVWKGIVSTQNLWINSKFIHVIITKGSIVKRFKLYFCHACHAFFHDPTRHHIQIRFKQAFRSRSLRFFTILSVTVTCTNLNIFHVMHFWRRCAVFCTDYQAHPECGHPFRVELAKPSCEIGLRHASGSSW